MDRLLQFLNHVNNLKRLPRTGWLLCGVSDPESVADHTCAVALLALFLAHRVNMDWTNQGLSRPLDVDRVTRLALLHDLAESVLTDLPRRTGRLLGGDVKRRAERSAMAELLCGLPNASVYADLWDEYDAASTPEARLVKDADKLEMVHQALCYQQRGQTNLAEFWQGHRWHYPASLSLFGELRQESLRKPQDGG